MGIPRLAVTAVLALAVTGCSDDDAQPDGPVTGTVALDRPPGGSPDGGTVAGHRGGGVEATVEGDTVAFGVRVRPADARVAVAGGRGVAVRGRAGRWTVRLDGLGRRTIVTVMASAAGRSPWSERVTVRRAPSGVPARREPQGVEPTRGPPGNADAAGGRFDIDARDFAFLPARMVVPAGAQVVWRGMDPDDHALRPVAGPDGAVLPRSGRIGPGDRYDLTTSKPGTYAYMCAIHPWMEGTVVAEP